MAHLLNDFFDLFSNIEQPLLVMFFSGLLSSTLLPGNSEIVFSALILPPLSQGHHMAVMWLFLIASLGNSLGSLSTYFLARLAPSPNSAKNTAKIAYAVRLTKKYGVWVLLFSWLPIIGDILCGVAGWLRLPIVPSTLSITFGKAARYGLIVWGLAA